MCMLCNYMLCNLILIWFCKLGERITRKTLITKNCWNITYEINYTCNPISACVLEHAHVCNCMHLVEHTAYLSVCAVRSICRQQPFRSLRAHQYSSDQMKILKDQSAQTTARVVSIAYRLWLPFLINRVIYR